MTWIPPKWRVQLAIFAPEKRSAIMAAIRGRNTRPEWVVRRYLHRHGLRHRLHVRKLPGCPDLVFPARRLALFVHGCFWHGHQGCSKATMPKTRAEFWQEKIGANRLRDARDAARLEALGWAVLVVWECEITRSGLAELLESVRSHTVRQSVRGGGRGCGARTRTAVKPLDFKSNASTDSAKPPAGPTH